MANLQKVQLENGEVITCINNIDKVKRIEIQIPFNGEYKPVICFSAN